MIKRPDTKAQRIKRHKRVRAKVSGTPERPRLNVFRSEKNIYAQIIDDVAGNIVDDLGVDVLFRTENVQAGSLGSAGDFGANALMTLDALCFGIGSFNHIGTPPYFLAPVLPTLRRMTSSAYLMPLPLYGSGGRFSRISAAN